MLDRFIRALLLRNRVRCSVVSRDARRQFLRTMMWTPLVLPVLPEVIERVTASGFTFTRSPGMADLIRGLVSPDHVRAWEAQQAFAAFISGPILQVIEQAPVISNLFSSVPPVRWEPSITIPLDLGSWDDEPLPGGVTNIHSPGIVSQHNTWCHGWPRKTHLS